MPFQLGFQRRFDAGYREARRMVESGELGTVYVVRLAGHDPAPPHESYIPASGGLFRDFSVHDFDVIRWLLGTEVAEVYADGGVRGFPVFAKYDDVDTGVATLRMEDGTLAVLTSSRHDPLGYDIRAELFGSRDSISVGLGPHTPMRSVEPGVPPPAGPAWPDFFGRFPGAYRAELIAFLSVARGETPPPAPPATASSHSASQRLPLDPCANTALSPSARSPGWRHGPPRDSRRCPPAASRSPEAGKGPDHTGHTRWGQPIVPGGANG